MVKGRTLVQRDVSKLEDWTTRTYTQLSRSVSSIWYAGVKEE